MKEEEVALRGMNLRMTTTMMPMTLKEMRGDPDGLSVISGKAEMPAKPTRSRSDHCPMPNSFEHGA